MPLNAFALGGRWKVEEERAVAGQGARLRLHFFAQNVFLVLSGKGAVNVAVDGSFVKSLRVGSNRLYTLLRLPKVRDAVLDVGFTQVSAYAFTFG